MGSGQPVWSLQTGMKIAIGEYKLGGGGGGCSVCYHFTKALLYSFLGDSLHFVKFSDIV